MQSWAGGGGAVCIKKLKYIKKNHPNNQKGKARELKINDLTWASLSCNEAGTKRTKQCQEVEWRFLNMEITKVRPGVP